MGRGKAQKNGTKAKAAPKVKASQKGTAPPKVAKSRTIAQQALSETDSSKSESDEEEQYYDTVEGEPSAAKQVVEVPRSRLATPQGGGEVPRSRLATPQGGGEGSRSRVITPQARAHATPASASFMQAHCRKYIIRIKFVSYIIFI